MKSIFQTCLFHKTNELAPTKCWRHKNMTISGKHCLRQKESSSILVYTFWSIKPGISLACKVSSSPQKRYFLICTLLNISCIHPMLPNFNLLILISLILHILYLSKGISMTMLNKLLEKSISLKRLMSFCRLAPSHLTALLPYQPEVSCICGFLFC